MNNTRYKSKALQKRPLSLIIGGVNKLGFELAELLLQNDGYVVFIDNYNAENIKKLSVFSKDSLISFHDYSFIDSLDENLKRLDYVFYFSHECIKIDKSNSKYFSKRNNYLDIILSLTSKYKAKFLLTKKLVQFGNNETELSRYNEFIDFATNLIREYINKVDLNARIIELGEMIGDGMDFEEKNSINKIILSAAKGESLKIPKKGMEKVWIINILDAANALLKAQFSRVTKEGTYLAAYPNPFTYISLAYKVQEIEKDSQDIEFYNDSIQSESLKNLPILLTEIGWTPKFSIEMALKQSISSAKIYLIEKGNVEEAKKGIKKRIKAFFEIKNQDSKKSNALVEGTGPVSRLIMERKRQEDSVRRSIMEDNKYLQQNKLKRPLGLTEKIEDSSVNFFIKSKLFFQNLRKQPKYKLFLYLLFLCILLSIYLFIISPIFVLGRNVGIIAISYNNLKDEIGRMDYESVSKSSENISNGIADLNHLIEKYDSIYKILGIDNKVGVLKEDLSSYKLFADGVSNLSYSLEPAVKYFNEYKSNLVMKSKEEGYLDLVPYDTDYENILLDISARSPYSKLGIDKIDKSIELINQSKNEILPNFIEEKFNNFNEEIKKLRGDFDLLDSLKFMPEVLGAYNQKTYAVVLQDNLNQTPSGGELSSLILAKISDGVIQDIDVVDLNRKDFKFETFKDYYLKEINLSKINPTQKIDSVFTLSSITEKSKYTEALNVFIKENLNQSVDGFIVLNNNAVNAFSKLFIEKQDPDQTNENGNILLSQFLTGFLGRLNTSVKDIFELNYTQLNEGNICLSFPESEYNKYLRENSLNGENTTSSDFFFKPSLNSNEILENPTKSQVEISSNITLTDSKIISYRNTFEITGNEQKKNLVVCLPLYIEDSDIQVFQTSVENYKINKGEDSKCIVVNMDNKSKVELGWNIRNFDYEKSDLSLVLKFGKIDGMVNKLSLDLKLEPSVSLVDISNLTTINSKNYLLSQTLSSDKSIKLTISK